MDNADRTVEIFVPAALPQPAGGAPPPPPGGADGAPAVSGNGPAPNGANGAAAAAISFDGAQLNRIPEGSKLQRPSPALDPIARARLSRAAKWVLLLGLVLFAVWLPASAVRPGNAGVFFPLLVLAATTLAATVATGLPRAILPRVFGRWAEPVDAARDWLTVGLVTGALYLGLISAARLVNFGPEPLTGRGTFPADWLQFRLPLLLLAGAGGVFAARGLALRREAVLSSSAAMAASQIVTQVVLLALLERVFEKALQGQLLRPGVAAVLGALAFVCVAGTVGVLTWAAAADAALGQIRRRRGGTGVDDGSGPVELTVTVVGGRESGKTVLLAGAFYEWSTQNIGSLRISPATTPTAHSDPSSGQGLANLEEVARELYVNYQFPVGTVSTQNLPFELSYGPDKVARFNFLDYPGGAIAGRVADDRVIREFWERVDDTDGLVMIADMSYVRRAHKDKDWLEVRNAYRQVMQRLVDRNGRRRVVPVALVLTKCDEYVNPHSGHIDTVALKAGIKEFQYDELEDEWRRLSSESGPGFAEFTTWITSAITYSMPQPGPDGRPDYGKPFQIAPPPPTIAPTGCASPLLWITAKVMRWNVTTFHDLSSFILGSTPRVRRRFEAVNEMERIAEERAGRA